MLKDLSKIKDENEKLQENAKKTSDIGKSNELTESTIVEKEKLNVQKEGCDRTQKE